MTVLEDNANMLNSGKVLMVEFEIYYYNIYAVLII